MNFSHFSRSQVEPGNEAKPHPDEWLRQSSPPRLRGGVRGGVL
ncbi:hypothetical protein NIES4073_14560 [Kalymmatonema gypsitolerans NIES-4073]|nr:hypothetical protein NIES4073_14560 [Scytonema sp. NIES-4073]